LTQASGLVSKDAIVLLSGGIDSAACARFLKNNDHSVRALFVDYGQKAVTPERRSAEALSNAIGITLDCVSLASPAQFGSGEVAGRNAFLVFAALLTGRLRRGVIALGIHSGTTYYDCSTAFAQSIDRLLAEHTDGQVRLSTPFITWSKKNIFEYYQASGLAIELTYSCESGQTPTCGTCLSCLDRRMLGC
jgi:7-cyano-7-deazaguanine synthase